MVLGNCEWSRSCFCASLPLSSAIHHIYYIISIALVIGFFVIDIKLVMTVLSRRLVQAAVAFIPRIFLFLTDLNFLDGAYKLGVRDFFHFFFGNFHQLYFLAAIHIVFFSVILFFIYGDYLSELLRDFLLHVSKDLVELVNYFFVSVQVQLVFIIQAVAFRINVLEIVFVVALADLTVLRSYIFLVRTDSLGAHRR